MDPCFASHASYPVVQIIYGNGEHVRLLARAGAISQSQRSQRGGSQKTRGAKPGLMQKDRLFTGDTRIVDTWNYSRREMRDRFSGSPARGTDGMMESRLDTEDKRKPQLGGCQEQYRGPFPRLGFRHYGWDVWGLGWQAEGERRAFASALRDRNIVAVFWGHSHSVQRIDVNGLPTFCVGSGHAGPDPGVFMVVRITKREMIVAEKKPGGWGFVDRVRLKKH